MCFILCKGVKFYFGNDFIVDDVVWMFNCLKELVDFKGIFEFLVFLIKVDDYIIEIKMVGIYLLIENVVIYIFLMDSKFYTGIMVDGKNKVEIVKYGNFFVFENIFGIGLFMVMVCE